jgi:hypothetical protein
VAKRQISTEKASVTVEAGGGERGLLLGDLDPRQVAAWRAMSPAERLEIAFQTYQFALDAVRATERERHPDLSPEELAWRVTRRMQGDPGLGSKP